MKPDPSPEADRNQDPQEGLLTFPLAGLLQHSLEERFRNVPIEQLAVLGEDGHIPYGIIHIQAHEPSGTADCS